MITAAASTETASGYTYMGRPIENLSREELLEAVGRLYERQKEEREAHEGHVKMLNSLLMYHRG